MVDVQVSAEHVIDLLEADAQSEQLVPPALLAGKVERRRMAFVLTGASVDQNGMMRRAEWPVADERRAGFM